MAYASRSGKARTSASFPQAFAVCDRCGNWRNWVDLKRQFDWLGAALLPVGNLLVCDRCYDTPNEQMRSIVLPPDPPSIINARVEPFTADEPNFMAQVTGSTVNFPTNIPVPGTTQMATQAGNNMTGMNVGVPPAPAAKRSQLGLVPGAQMTPVNAVKWGQSVPFLSINANGTPVVTVTCSSPHGLSTGAQVGIEGATSSEANGVFSIAVTSATAFTFNANVSIKSGSLLGSHVTMVTTNVGLPLGYNLVPQSGI